MLFPRLAQLASLQKEKKTSGAPEAFLTASILANVLSPQPRDENYNVQPHGAVCVVPVSVSVVVDVSVVTVVCVDVVCVEVVVVGTWAASSCQLLTWSCQQARASSLKTQPYAVKMCVKGSGSRGFDTDPENIELCFVCGSDRNRSP